MQYTVNIAAGERVPVMVGGRMAQILTITGANAVELAVIQGMRELERVRTAARGIKFASEERFDRVELASSVACTVELIVSDAVVDINTADGANVVIQATNPIPVKTNTGDSLSVIAYGSTTSMEPLGGSIPAGTTDTICSPDGNRRELRVLNTGTTELRIGPLGTTSANAVIRLQPGDLWIEDRAANRHWVVVNVGTVAGAWAAQALMG